MAPKPSEDPLRASFRLSRVFLKCSAKNSGALDRCIRQNDGEFLPAIARREIASLGAVIERASNQSEHLIAGLMSMGVVEILEEIDIGDDQAKRRLFYPRFHYQFFERLIEPSAVCQGG